MANGSSGWSELQKLWLNVFCKMMKKSHRFISSLFTKQAICIIITNRKLEAEVIQWVIPTVSKLEEKILFRDKGFVGADTVYYV